MALALVPITSKKIALRESKNKHSSSVFPPAHGAAHCVTVAHTHTPLYLSVPGFPANLNILIGRLRQQSHKQCSDSP